MSAALVSCLRDVLVRTSELRAYAFLAPPLNKVSSVLQDSVKDRPALKTSSRNC